MGNGYFELTYTSAKADGSNAKTTSVAKDLKCEFSKMDPVALECRGDEEINTQMHYSNYILVTKNVMTIKNRSANPNLNNRSFKASFTVRDGLSGCKAL